jgi:hypothetical protein
MVIFEETVKAAGLFQKERVTIIKERVSVCVCLFFAPHQINSVLPLPSCYPSLFMVNKLDQELLKQQSFYLRCIQ